MVLGSTMKSMEVGTCVRLAWNESVPRLARSLAPGARHCYPPRAVLLPGASRVQAAARDRGQGIDEARSRDYTGTTRGTNCRLDDAVAERTRTSLRRCGKLMEADRVLRARLIQSSPIPPVRGKLDEMRLRLTLSTKSAARTGCAHPVCSSPTTSVSSELLSRVAEAAARS